MADSGTGSDGFITAEDAPTGTLLEEEVIVRSKVERQDSRNFFLLKQVITSANLIRKSPRGKMMYQLPVKRGRTGSFEPRTTKRPSILAGQRSRPG